MALSPFSPFLQHLDQMFSDRSREAPYWLKAGDSVNMASSMTKVLDDKNRFGLNLDVSHFKPEELKISLEGHIITVEGNHEIHDHDQYLKRSFVRKWTLPEECDLHTVHSTINKEGHLIIDAPKQGAPTSRIIPIESSP